MTTATAISTKIINVDLPEGKSYPIHIGENLLESPDLFHSYCKDKEVMIVTNDTVGQYYLERLLLGLMPVAKVVHAVSVIDSEKAKSAEYLNRIYTRLLEANFSRKCVIVALGGGVIGDLAGYAAATYQRGVDFIQIPTTLLAQVDSSVGGKTAINHELGKNMIGAFYQPKAVFIDLQVLDTLDDRQFACGLAEVIKYGLIMDEKFFNFLEQNLDGIKARDLSLLSQVIHHCCDLKRQVVQEDEKEQGLRAILNLGHTYGHAIEANFEYGNWLHGEAISVGMVLAGITSLHLKDRNIELGINYNYMDHLRMVEIFTRAGLPTCLPAIEENDAMTMMTWDRPLSPEEFLDYMQRDKKNIANQIVLVLLEKLGKAFVYKEATTEDISNAISTLAQEKAPGYPPLSLEE